MLIKRLARLAGCTTCVLALSAVAEALPRQRVAVVDASASARIISGRIRELVSSRNDLELISSEHLAEWFGTCSLDPSEKCLRTAAKQHHVELVLRVWGSEGAGKLSVTVDRIEPKVGFVSSFESGGIATADNASLQDVAQRAVAKVIDGKELPRAAPIATPDPAKPAPVDLPPAVASKPAPEPAVVASAPAPAGTSSMRVASYVLGGVGLAAVGVGVAEALAVSSKNSSFSNSYPAASAGDPAAQAKARADLDSARSAAVVSNVALVGGATAIAAAVTMFVLAPDAKTPQAAATVIAGKPGLVVAGHF